MMDPEGIFFYGVHFPVEGDIIPERFERDVLSFLLFCMGYEDYQVPCKRLAPKPNAGQRAALGSMVTIDIAYQGSWDAYTPCLTTALVKQDWGGFQRVPTKTLHNGADDRALASALAIMKAWYTIQIETATDDAYALSAALEALEGASEPGWYLTAWLS